MVSTLMRSVMPTPTAIANYVLQVLCSLGALMSARLDAALRVCTTYADANTRERPRATCSHPRKPLAAASSFAKAVSSPCTAAVETCLMPPNRNRALRAHA